MQVIEVHGIKTSLNLWNSNYSNSINNKSFNLINQMIIKLPLQYMYAACIK